MANENTLKKQIYVVPFLTKDNQERRNWKGSKVYFFNKHETIQHLFFDCHYARFLSHAVHWVFGIAPLKGPNG